MPSIPWHSSQPSTDWAAQVPCAAAMHRHNCCVSAAPYMSVKPLPGTQQRMLHTRSSPLLTAPALPHPRRLGRHHGLLLLLLLPPLPPGPPLAEVQRGHGALVARQAQGAAQRRADGGAVACGGVGGGGRVEVGGWGHGWRQWEEHWQAVQGLQGLTMGPWQEEGAGRCNKAAPCVAGLGCKGPYKQPHW